MMANGAKVPALRRKVREKYVVVQDFGVPPTGDAVAEILAKEADAARKAANPETIRVPWRGSYIQLPVVSVEVKLLYLNPNTHRVAAQRSCDTARDALLEKKPWGEDGQLYLRDLLRAKPTDPSQEDPEYLELVEELKRHGQQVPGIVTPWGVLVDANTRCVALRELGEQYIRVGVLPETTTWNDVNAIELQIQLRRDKRREYPYINRLISIEEQLNAGMAESDVAADWNIAEKSLKADRWAYALILEAIDRSTTEDGSRLTLLQFNDQQESFREFYRHHAQVAATDPDAADELRETRLASLLLGLPKTSLRYVQGDFYSRYLERQLPVAMRPKAPAPTTVKIPGLEPHLAAPATSDAAASAKALTDRLLKEKAQSVSSDPQKAAAAAISLSSADKVFRKAAKLAGQDVTLAKKQTAVPDRITEATDYISQASDEFARSRQARTLDEDAFDSALLELQSALESLAKQSSRAFSSPGEGVAWLLRAAQRPAGDE